MSHLIRGVPVQALIHQLPAAAPALLITEAFYRFHSFILEAAAFLATWYVFDAVAGTFRDRFRR
jgi:hypothetical protein